MFGLSFLSPLFLIGAVAIAIPIVLHLFRRRTEMVVEFPAVRLLQKAPVEQQRRRRLRELILLALRVTALALLAFSFARPYFVGATASLVSPTTIVALDTSMSMSAPGQFDAARQAARRAVESAPLGHMVGLLTFSDTASLVVPPTSDRGGVVAAIQAANVGAGGTRFRTALARAAEAISGSQGRIVVVSDLQQAGWETADEGAVPDGITVETVSIRPPQGNVAVTALRRDEQAIVAAIHNFGQRPVKVPVQLRLDGRDLKTERVDIAPQSAADVRLIAALPPRGGVHVAIEDREGYQPDNSRYLVLDPASAVPVIVLTSQPPGSSSAGLYVERAVGVAAEGRAFRVRVFDGRTFSSLSAEDFGEPAAIVVLGTETLDRKGREAIARYLRDGGRVLLSLGPDVDSSTLKDTCGVDLDIERDPVAPAGGGTVTLVAVDARHPIFRPFLSPTGALGDVYFERYRRLKEQKDRTVLARFSGGPPALVEQTVERGRLLVFASDLDNQWNRFPLNAAFVPFMVETMRYLTLGREQRQSWVLPDVPSGFQPVPGVFPLPAPDKSSPPGHVAINVDVRESNPASATPEEFAAAITRLGHVPENRATAEAREQEERQRLWQLGLLVMLIALAGEGLLGRKAS